ncbi:hypothetical protein ACIBAG_43345 [Streptomyces sp. NPDC051243]|uniref:hypothetical protein n=1 Tax=Streptomyces sp. NPDC051243 TaxID=3365646 RepID=UPI00378904A3
MTPEEPRHLLVRARGGPSPRYEAEDPWAIEDLGAYTRDVPLDDDRPALPAELADALRSWSLSRPPDGFASRAELRGHVEQGLTLARRLRSGPTGSGTSPPMIRPPRRLCPTASSPTCTPGRRAATRR